MKLSKLGGQQFDVSIRGAGSAGCAAATCSPAPSSPPEKKVSGAFVRVTRSTRPAMAMQFRHNIWAAPEDWTGYDPRTRSVHSPGALPRSPAGESIAPDLESDFAITGTKFQRATVR